MRTTDHADRAAWDGALRDAVAAHEPDLVVSAGFMKLLGPAFLEAFGNRVINTHPALLPAFPGMHAVADALEAGVKVTGSTVHFVDTGVDTGPIIAQEPVVVDPDDDESSLHERIKVVEREMLVGVGDADGDEATVHVEHGQELFDRELWRSVHRRDDQVECRGIRFGKVLPTIVP